MMGLTCWSDTLSFCRKSNVIALCAALAACTTPGIRPDKVTVQVVKVPTPVACSVSPGTKPELVGPKAFADAVAAAPDLFEVAKLYASARMEAVDYIARLEAANAGCQAQ